jgi:CheY-like chemotaxis protein
MATVLIIDDHSYMRALLREHLEGLGFEVLAAEDGAAGLEVLENASVDLLVSDILMPGDIEGIEVIATARELRPNIPIIAISVGRYYCAGQAFQPL